MVNTIFGPVLMTLSEFIWINKPLENISNQKSNKSNTEVPGIVMEVITTPIKMNSDLKV